MRIYLEMAIGSPILLPLLLFADDLLNGGQQLGNAAFHVAGRFISCLPANSCPAGMICTVLVGMFIELAM